MDEKNTRLLRGRGNGEKGYSDFRPPPPFPVAASITGGFLFRNTFNIVLFRFVVKNKKLVN